ncbi:MAG: signal peptide peptidase SppA [Candidatus Methanofastidiosia archaeon]
MKKIVAKKLVIGLIICCMAMAMLAGCIVSTGDNGGEEGCPPCEKDVEVKILESSQIDAQTINELKTQIEALRTANLSPDGKIALVRIYGVLGEEDVGIFRKTLIEVGDDSQYSAVVLWVDSPGGGVGATTEMYKEILKLKSKKPVVVFSGDMIASGGYYLACAADLIVADMDCLVGNIGVIYAHVDATQYYKDFGLKITVIKTGDYKDMGADWRALTDEEYNWMKDMVFDAYNRFVQAVAFGRNMTNSDALALSDGKIWLPEKAKEEGIIDYVGDLEFAIKKAEDLAGLIKAEVIFFELWDEGSTKVSGYYNPLRYQWEETLNNPFN